MTNELIEPTDTSVIESTIKQRDGSENDNSEESKNEKEEENNRNDEKVIKLEIDKKNNSEDISETVSFKKKVGGKIVSFLDNKWNITFLVVLLAALLIRFKYIGQESLWNDAAVHLWYAIKATKEPLFFFSRQYLVEEYATVQTLTAIFYLFTKNVFIAGKIVAILFGLSGIIFMYLLGSELKNKFFGLISASLLGFHHILWFFGVRLLADAPLVSLIVITLYCLVKLEKEKTLFWGFLSAFMFLAMILTKKQSILFFVAFLIYLIIFKRKEAIKNKAMLVSWLIPVAIITISGLLFKNNFLLYLIKYFFINLRGLHEPGLNIAKLFIWVFSWYLLIPMILGFILVLIYKKKEYYLSLIFFLFYWFCFEIGVNRPEDRYILPLLPMGVLFTTFGLIELSNYLVLFVGKKKNSDYLKKGLIMLFVLFVCWNFYNTGDQIINKGSYGFIGYNEAGEWLKENVPDGTPIFVGSPRMMRLFIERDYGGPGGFSKYGGSLWYLRADEYLKNRTAFEEDLKMLSKKSDVYLEIDVWEFTQPSWYYPITKDSLIYFERLGFKSVNVIERIIKTNRVMKNRGVIYIFKKEKIKSNNPIIELAKCLADSGTILYVSSNCDICYEQKDMFGYAFNYLSVFDCTGKEEDCMGLGVKYVPAWKFPDGTIGQGVGNLSQLSKKSGCKYGE